MIVCALLPRFALSVAAGGAGALAGTPLALAPEAGAHQRIGEASGAAEAFGVRTGMGLGEALARCPELGLLAPDPLGVTEAWDRALGALESIGAEVEDQHPGIAHFDARGLLGLHGGIQRVLERARRALGRPVRLGAAPTRFCALAAAHQARTRRAVVVSGGATDARHHLADQPVDLLGLRPATAPLVGCLERLGVRTLGELAALPLPAVVDRFGAAGRVAHRLARGEDDSPRPRRREERLEEILELPEAVSGAQLEHALGLLVDRLLARPERRARSLRAAVVFAALVEGGTWRERVTFREALAQPVRLRLALGSRLALLPAPAQALGLGVARFGPAVGAQQALLAEPAAARRARLGEAVHQARAAAGPEAALRVISVDPDSRVPERRALLAPFPA